MEKINGRYRFTLAERKKISRRLEGNKNALGFIPSKELKIKRGLAISKSLTGRILSEKEKLGRIKAGRKMKGRKNPFWKGMKAGMSSIHKWVYRYKGNPRKCEACGNSDKKIYDWANKSRKYKRQLSDWIRLCRSCHKKYDLYV